MARQCTYCNTVSTWQLCIMRTWFTLFFIPIIPYRKKYCIACPNCGAYIQLSVDEFKNIQSQMLLGNSTNQNSYHTPLNYNNQSNYNNQNYMEDLKYQEKNDTQINFIKAMEEAERRKLENRSNI